MNKKNRDSNQRYSRRNFLELKTNLNPFNRKSHWVPRKSNDSLVKISSIKHQAMGFPGGTVVENLPANAGDTGSSPGLGRSHMPQSN